VIEQEFLIGDTPRLKVRIRSGSVEVTRAEDRRIRVQADTDDSAFLVDQRGDTVHLGGGNDRRGGWAAVTAFVPPDCEVDVATASANVGCNGELARLVMSSSSGDLRFGTLSRLQVKTASGDISGDAVTGEANAITASGDVMITTLGGGADLSTASGDVTVNSGAGDISATSVSGDIRIDLFAGSELRATSVSGTVRLGIPKGTRLDLDAETYSGIVDLPEPELQPGPPEREMRVRVKLVSGDLKILRAG
jgi:hypothetical protein